MRRQDRATIIAHLGTPGISYELYAPGKGRQRRLDLYRLSAKNDRVYRVIYDAEDRVDREDVDTGPCRCALCSQASPDEHAAVTMEVLARVVLVPNPGTSSFTTKGRVDGLVVQPGRPYATTDQAGGQAWSNYGEVWRIAGTASRFFIASGSVPVRDRETRPDAELPIHSYTIVTAGPECSSQ